MAVAPTEARTLAQLLDRQASLHPARSALRTDTQAITYGALARLVQHAAHRLRHSWGVRAGDRVAWLGLNDPAQVVLLFALARLGAALLPLNHRLPPPGRAGGGAAAAEPPARARGMAGAARADAAAAPGACRCVGGFGGGSRFAAIDRG